MQAHILQHVEFEGPASIAVWLDAAGYQKSYTRFYQATTLPRTEGIDLLVVMGGPMSVNDEEQYPWLVGEKEFIREAMLAGISVLGVCLGAQLMAAAVDARVYPNAVKEIGWLPVQGIDSQSEEVFHFPPSLEVFHWHGETFDLPQGAVQLAHSAGCENQAFQFGRKAIGLQFHLETTPKSAWEIVSNCRHELVPAKYVQTEEEILSVGREQYRLMYDWLDRVLSFITQADHEEKHSGLDSNISQA